MAGLTLTPEDVRVNGGVVITGDDWGNDPVDVSISRGSVTPITLTPDEDGNITSEGTFVFTPDKIGTWAIRAENNDNLVEVQLTVWSS